MTGRAGRGSNPAHALFVGAVALVARLAVVVWARTAIPPTADGKYYHELATRIADGDGYTWLWPDGVVTYAAHYPVGYPALVAVGYAVFGPQPVVAMAFNAVVGALSAVAMWSLVARASRPNLALAAGLVVAVHPVLVPYTAALMTEGVTASLLTIAASLAAHGREARRPLRWAVATGLIMGGATLVRPQCLALAPVLGFLMAAGREANGTRRASERPVVAALVVVAIALAVCAPWTARNCARMDRCALVSVNGGWNLEIGTQTENGGWQEIAVPEGCKEVFQEAAKDACFGADAKKVILRAPLAWLARAPSKLRVTFDYFGAAPWYLHTANPARFPYEAKVAFGAVETLASRLLLAAALIALFRMNEGARVASLLRKGVALVGLVACVLVPGAIAYVALAVATLALGWRALVRAPLVVSFTAVVIGATALTHAVFFGAGRYGLVVVPFVAAVAFVRNPRLQNPA